MNRALIYVIGKALNVIYKSLFEEEQAAPIPEKVIYFNDACPTTFSCLESLLTQSDFNKQLPETYWHDSFNLKYHIVECLQFSPYYRKLIQGNTIDELIKILSDDAPSLTHYVDIDLLTKELKNLKKNISDFVLEKIPVDTKLLINGTTYNGARSLKTASLEKVASISNRWEPFPCFDSYDYANENRRYNNYCFCSKDSDQWKEVEKLKLQDSNFCLVGEGLPKELLPMVYVNDEYKLMIYAHL